MRKGLGGYRPRKAAQPAPFDTRADAFLRALPHFVAETNSSVPAHWQVGGAGSGNVGGGSGGGRSPDAGLSVVITVPKRPNGSSGASVSVTVSDGGIGAAPLGPDPVLLPRRTFTASGEWVRPLPH